MSTKRDFASQRKLPAALGLMCALAVLIMGAVLSAREAEATRDLLEQQRQLTLRLRDWQGVLVHLADAQASQHGGLSVLIRSLDASRSDDDALRARLDKARALLGSAAAPPQLAQARAEIAAVMEVAFAAQSSLGARIAASTRESERLLWSTLALLLVFVVLGSAQLGTSVRARARSERFIREITDHLPMRIAYADPQQRYRFVNLAQCQRFGKERHEILGKTRSELTGGQTDGLVKPRVDAVLAGQPQRFEFEEMLAGKVRRIESQLIPDVANDGEVQGFYTMGIDITERAATERALRELNEIVERTPDFVVQTDHRGAIQYLNPTMREFLGLAPGESLKTRSFRQFSTAATSAAMHGVIVPAVRRHGAWVGEATVRAAGERIVPVSLLVIAHRDAAGQIRRHSAVMRDITAEVEARQRIQVQAATLQSVMENTPAIVAVLGPDERYRYVNHALAQWHGTSREAMIGKTLSQVAGAAERARSKPWIDRALDGETVSFEKNFPNRVPARHMAVSYFPLRLEDGRVDGFVSMAHDITQHRDEKLRLLQQAERDALTGLLNRAGFQRYLRQQSQAGEAATLALLYIDLDHFKPVNDQHGHPVGDALLRLFSQRLQALVRPTDAVARLGGDEFAVALSGVREQLHAETVADKILEAAHLPFEVGALHLQIGASVGLASDASDAHGLEGLIARADAMLYKAKAAGRGRRA